MNTNKAYKVSALLIIAVLALGLLTSIPIQASTGHPVLGVVDSRDSPTTIDLADFNVSIKAGSDEVIEMDGLPATGYLAIVFAIGSTNLVTFSGSQFDLYISKDGYSAISPDDKCYARGFLVSDLNAPLKKVSKTNPLLKGGKADFYIGTITIGSTSYKVLIGPIPFDITPEYQYIKIFDGAATAVAVSAQIVDILPALEITPTEGPGGALVTLKGVALQPNKLLNLTYGGSSANDEVFGQAWTDNVGKLTYSWRIKDLKAEWIGFGSVPSDTVTVYVWYNETGDLIDYVEYEEYYRAFVQLKSVKYGDEPLPFTDLYTGAGNNTLGLDVYVFDTVVVAGAWWNPTGPVSFSVDGKFLGSVTPNASGFFNTTFKVPELTVGWHTVKVSNAGVLYVFYIYVHPTLVLIPEKGYVGDLVEARVYGFPADVLVGIWWYGYNPEVGYSDWINIVNGTTGPDGKFNVTVRFVVPHDYGGEHDVTACYPWYVCTTWAEATFTILPKFVVVPSVISNDGSEVRVIGLGFEPGKGYAINIDNNFLGANGVWYWPSLIWANETGDIEVVFIAAGFRPGLHVVSIYPEASEPPYKPTYALFTVTEEGDPILTAIQADLATVISMLDSLDATITSVQGDVAVIKTDVGTIKADVAAIKPVVTSIDGNVATVKTDVGTLKGTITSVQGDVATVKTDVGTIKADVSAIKSATEGISMISTAVWLAVVFSLISVLIAAYLVMVVRRKIAG